MTDETKTPEELRQERERAAREANKARNDDRLERLNAIANQSDQLKEQDGLEDVDDEAWEEARTGKAPGAGRDLDTPERAIADAEADDRATDEARDAGAQDVKLINGETHYLLIVNGQERWMTLQQLRETSSKVSAADQYLRDAKDAARKAVAAPPFVQDEEPSPKQDRARELLNRALMGEQEAVDALAQLIDARPSRVTPDVLQAVDERVDGRLTFRTVVEWFDHEYKAELADPDLRARIVRRDKEMATLYPEMDFRARLTEVGDEARAMRISKARNSPPVREDGFRSKEQRKASVRAIPSAAGRQVDESDDEDGETYESAIQSIAKSRGQGRPIVHKR